MRPDGGSTINPGLVLDERYRITAALGRGGMGSVYRAEHIGLKRPVAIKLLNKELRSYKASNERLAREAFATGRLDHPNCVAIMDLGEMPDGTPYLAMELLEGRSLSDALDEQPRFGVERALRITRHLLYGLAHAHDAGVVHRDLKPDNIFLVAREGEPDFPKILDFGIAKLTGEAMVEEGGNELTEAGMAIGSPTYMSPEQAIGGTIDPRSDLYSLSVVLFEMLAGRPPFVAADDDKLAVLRMHLTAPVPRLAEVAADVIVPESVEELVRRGLAKRVEERFPNADDFGRHIDAALHGLARTHAVPALATGEAAAPTSSVPSGDKPAPTRSSPPASATAMVSAPTSPRPARPGWSPARRATLVGGVLGIAFLITMVATFAGGAEGSLDAANALVRNEGSRRAAPSEDTMVFPPDELRPGGSGDLDDRLDRYEELIDNGQGSRVAPQLAKLARDFPDSARLHVLLGRAYMARDYWRDGFDAFRRALELDHSLRYDAKLIKSALLSLTSRSRPEAGIRFLTEDIGEPAVPYLEETAANSGSRRQRENAARTLERLR